MDKFSLNLEKIMQERKINQTALALQTGISQAAISRYIKGIASPGAKELHCIAKAFGVSMDELWTGACYTESNRIENSAAEKELAELKRSLRIVFRAMSEPDPPSSSANK